MTPQFTTSCYVQVDDPKKRKEVCEKLEKIGYRWCGINPKYLNHIVVYEGRTYVQSLGVAQQLARYNCSDNIDLFLALAGMRSDMDKGQYFIDERDGSMNFSEDDDIGLSALVYRRATATEIVEHFNNK